MNPLDAMKCAACRGDDPGISDADMARYLPLIPDWRIDERNGIRRLERTFKFKGFAGALAFTDRVGALAETEGHHPVITTAWGKVVVEWWTHEIKGLHLNDFIMASQTDAAYKASTAEESRMESKPNGP
jgi:4a-hydroxytetrahydrobiopterin dehydratase